MVEGPDLIIFNGQGGNGLFGDSAGSEWPASAPLTKKGRTPEVDLLLGTKSLARPVRLGYGVPWFG